MHAATCFEVMKKPERNILKNLTTDERQEVRKTVISMVLATDNAVHAKHMGELQACVMPLALAAVVVLGRAPTYHVVCVPSGGAGFWTNTSRLLAWRHHLWHCPAAAHGLCHPHCTTTRTPSTVPTARRWRRCLTARHECPWFPQRQSPSFCASLFMPLT